jgi:hypothetical protein
MIDPVGCPTEHARYIIALVPKMESEGIPVLLKYESVARVYGFTADGLAQVKILVPQEQVEEAKQIIESKEHGQIEE